MSRPNGFIALTTVLIIVALASAVAIGLLTRSLSESRLALDQEQSERVRALANACAEEGVARLAANLSYVGNESILIGTDSCQVLGITGSGATNRTITASSTYSGYVANVLVTLTQVSPTVIVGSWQDF